MKSQWKRNDSLVTRFGKPLVSLFPANPSLSDPSWDYEHVSTSLVQTRIGIRWVDLPSLHVRWSHPHIPEWCISYPLDHSWVSGSLWIFGVGEWRRGYLYQLNSNDFLQWHLKSDFRFCLCKFHSKDLLLWIHLLGHSH